MVKPILFVAQNGLAFACGAGLLGWAWLVSVLAISYVRSIFTESESVPGGNFRNLQGRDFEKSEINIKMGIAKRLVVSVLLYGIGFAAKAMNVV